jgi:carbamoyl-phosphate synthase large chain|nr:hypothetical protein [uncultured Campylobacter sp.]
MLYEDGEAGFAQDIKTPRSYYGKACAANAYKCGGSVWMSYRGLGAVSKRAV